MASELPDQELIRRYVGTDEPRVREIGARLTVGFAGWRAPNKVADTVSSWIDTAIAGVDDDKRIMLVAADQAGTVVGFVAAAVQDHYIDGRDAYIGELAVDEAYGRRGIAQRLIGEVEQWACEHGCDRLTLQTGAANTVARQFYEKHGFAYEDVSLAREINSGVCNETG